jgi:hypothetical protein
MAGKLTRVHIGDGIPPRDAHYRRGRSQKQNRNLEIGAPSVALTAPLSRRSSDAPSTCSST